MGKCVVISPLQPLEFCPQPPFINELANCSPVAVGKLITVILIIQRGRVNHGRDIFHNRLLQIRSGAGSDLRHVRNYGIQLTVPENPSKFGTNKVSSEPSGFITKIPPALKLAI